MLAQGEVIESPRSVMTFRVAGEWVAIPLEQVARITAATKLCPVPLASPQHLGLLDDNTEVIPVLTIDEPAEPRESHAGERLVAILHVRGEAVGLAVERAGRICNGYRSAPASVEPPPMLKTIGATSILSDDGQCWLIDPDNLWRHPETNRFLQSL